MTVMTPDNLYNALRALCAAAIDHAAASELGLSAARRKALTARLAKAASRYAIASDVIFGKKGMR